MLQIRALRRCVSEIVAFAIQRLYPDAALLGGEATDEGFFYDVLLKRPLDNSFIPQIEESLRSLIAANLPIRILTMMRKNAMELLRDKGQKALVNLLSKDPREVVEIVQIEDFFDVCEGFPFSFTKEAIHTKVLEIIPSKRRRIRQETFSVTRIQGTAFPTKESLKKFLKFYEKRSRHSAVVLAEELALLSPYEEAGEGMWGWLPRGEKLKKFLKNLLEEVDQKQGIEWIQTPHQVSLPFWQQRKEKGWDEALLEGDAPLLWEGQDKVPISSFTPLHAFLWGKRKGALSLPVKWAEWGTLWEMEKDDLLFGLHRTRLFEADGAHLFCARSQALEIVISSLQLIDKMIRIFDFNLEWHLSLNSSLKGQQKEKEARDLLVRALDACAISYQMNPHPSEEGLQLEGYVIDEAGRSWKVSTLGVMMNIASRFGFPERVEHVAEIPVMIRRSVFGSLERFVALLLEKTGGSFPFWLAPEQGWILVMKQVDVPKAYEWQERGKQQGFRLKVEERPVAGPQFLQKTLEEAERYRIPYLLKVEDGQNPSLTIRSFTQKEWKKIASFEEAIEFFKKGIVA